VNLLALQLGTNAKACPVLDLTPLVGAVVTQNIIWDSFIRMELLLPKCKEDHQTLYIFEELCNKQYHIY
jgi:hypothetical protein